LTDNTLPNDRYNKNIHIDDNAMSRVGPDTRIALLRIIQEAITNIIKHAKAKNIDILIYEEVASLIMEVKDDGIGLGKMKSGNGKSAIGLESIRRRTKYLNGDIKISSQTKGTEIVITIPL